MKIRTDFVTNSSSSNYTVSCSVQPYASETEICVELYPEGFDISGGVPTISVDKSRVDDLVEMIPKCESVPDLYKLIADAVSIDYEYVSEDLFGDSFRWALENGHGGDWFKDSSNDLLSMIDDAKDLLDRSLEFKKKLEKCRSISEIKSVSINEHFYGWGEFTYDAVCGFCDRAGWGDLDWEDLRVVNQQLRKELPPYEIQFLYDCFNGNGSGDFIADIITTINIADAKVEKAFKIDSHEGFSLFGGADSQVQFSIKTKKGEVFDLRICKGSDEKDESESDNSFSLIEDTKQIKKILSSADSVEQLCHSLLECVDAEDEFKRLYLYKPKEGFDVSLFENVASTYEKLKILSEIYAEEEESLSYLFGRINDFISSVGNSVAHIDEIEKVILSEYHHHRSCFDARYWFLDDLARFVCKDTEKKGSDDRIVYLENMFQSGGCLYAVSESISQDKVTFEALMDEITRNGGQYSGRISYKTDFLIYDPEDITSYRYQEAVRNNIKCINMYDYEEIISHTQCYLRKEDCANTLRPFFRGMNKKSFEHLVDMVVKSTDYESDFGPYDATWVFDYDPKTRKLGSKYMVE